ncbi:MAG: Holliday junction resolvase RuvX [Planctomycetes bacterium]|nr:Holliday junction resolvase RuvX [Planctomycetota bacterium]
MGAVLALDYGTKRVGVAVTDSDRRYVFPRDTLTRTTPEDDLAALRAIVGDDGVDLMVVGVPFNADGTEGPMAKTAREWGGKLAEALGLPCEWVDERYTSQEAEEGLRETYPKNTRKRRMLRDRAAAVLILKTWMEHGPCD